MLNYQFATNIPHSEVKLNVFKILYGDIKKEEKRTINVISPDLNWGLLSDKLTSEFSIYSKIPVGKTNPKGVEFKLNYPNFYPAVPKVKIIENEEDLIILQNYDFKARATQYYWISGWVFGIFFISIISLLDFLDSRVEPEKRMLAITLFLFLLCVLFYLCLCV